MAHSLLNTASAALFPMFSRSLWRPLAGAVLLALPALTLVPGCGGGGSGNNGGNQVTQRLGVDFYDGTTNLATQANLSVTFNYSPGSTQSVTGFLNVLGASSGVPTATPTGTGSATATPTSTTAAQLARRGTRALPTNFIPGAATYQVTGTASLSSDNRTINVDLKGAFEPQRAFTITGNFVAGQTLTLTSTLVQPNFPAQEGTIQLRVLNAPIIVGATPTPTGNATATPTGTTPIGTATPTGTSPIGTATPTTFGSATPTPTVIPTVTPTPFVTVP